MKILIIGCGQMGFSHLKSFLHSKIIYEIDITDKKKRLKEIKKLLTNKQKYQLNFLSNIPTNKNYDLAIISTSSIERFSIFQKLVSKNYVKLFLFEKFIFSQKEQYKKFKILYNKFSKRIMVNSFGAYIYEKCFSKNFQVNKINLSINVREGTLFTSMIHYFDFFYLITKKTFNIDFSKIIKIIPSKRKNFSEGVGEVQATNAKGILKIKTAKKSDVEIKMECYKVDYKLILKENKFYFYKNHKLSKIFDFPFAYELTQNLVINRICFKKNFNYLSKISLNALTSLHKQFNKKIIIT